MERSTVRVLLVEDFKPYREFVTSLFDENPDLGTICEASDGLEAVEKARQLKPHLILMDIGLPKLDGLEAARRIRKLMPASKIVFLTQETSADIVTEAFNLGAWGYIVKRQAGTELLARLVAILQGKRFVSKGLNHNEFALAKGSDGAN